MKFCENCGKEIMDEAQFCGFCGNAVATDKNDTFTEENAEEASANKISVEENINAEISQEIPVAEVPTKKKFIFSKLTAIIIAAILVVCVGVGGIVAKTVSLNKYEEMLTDAYESMTYGAEQAEMYASLESKVWRNCIYENDSTETDKYTKNKYGWFYDDFNDALTSFREGESLTYSIVNLNVLTVNRYMSELKDCPKKFDDKYEALKELYVAYSDMTNLVIGSSTYSCNSFSEALDDARSNYKSALSSAKLLLE